MSVIPLANMGPTFKLPPMGWGFYVPKYFRAEELVTPKFYVENKDHPERIWGQFDPRALWTADAMREIFGSQSVNTWAIGGDRTLCGLRPADARVGAALSQHKRGAAFDLHPVTTTADAMRAWVLDNPGHPACQYITCLEAGVSWFHFDCRNHDRSKLGILLVRP